MRRSVTWVARRWPSARTWPSRTRRPRSSTRPCASSAPLDILVNNAGVTHWGPLAETALADFDRLVAVNARGPFLMMQAAAAQLADGGRVVNVSSAVTSTALPGSALYAGTKAFLDQVTQVAALEFAPRRITVNAVAPGSSASGRLAHLTSERRGELGASFTLGRIGSLPTRLPWSPSWSATRPASSPVRSSTTTVVSGPRPAVPASGAGRQAARPRPWRQTDRCLSQSRAACATSRQPWSIVSEWPRSWNSMRSVMAGDLWYCLRVDVEMDAGTVWHWT